MSNVPFEHKKVNNIIILLLNISNELIMYLPKTEIRENLIILMWIRHKTDPYYVNNNTITQLSCAALVYRRVLV